MAEPKRNLIRILIVFTLGIFLASCGEKVALLSGLPEQDANEIVSTLVIEGVHARKMSDKSGVTVMIAVEDMARAVKIIKAAGLPNKTQANLGEVFKKEGIISTPLEERARYIYALSQELEYTLSQIDNVVLARVHVVLPERVAPGQPIQPSSAAVFIKHTFHLDPDVVDPRVRSMVASSIPGLNNAPEEKISVSFLETEMKVSEVRWKSLGPFIVQERSVNALRGLLIGCIATVIILLAITIVMTIGRSRTWLVKRVPKLTKIVV